MLIHFPMKRLILLDNHTMHNYTNLFLKKIARNWNDDVSRVLVNEL